MGWPLKTLMWRTCMNPNEMRRSCKYSHVHTAAALLSQARTALAAGRMDGAKSLVQAVLRRLPRSCEALGIGAAADFRAGRLAEAAMAFGQIYALLRARRTATPAALAQAAHNLATVLDESGDAVNAEAAYREALALQPDRA